MQQGFHEIGDYGLIGDTRSAALVARDGSVDWLCLPRFDAPSVFAAVLDPGRGGHLRISPATTFTASRRYLPDTNVLETAFETESGRVVLRDAMILPVGTTGPFPDHELLREIECQEGEVLLAIDFKPRPDYASAQVRLQDRRQLGIRWDAPDLSLTLLSDERLKVAADGASASTRFSLRRGERRYVSLASDVEAPAVLPPLAGAARLRLAATADWWRSWARECSYAGRYRAAVVRSALALKLMSFSPSGAIVAAPTTSLPEEIGGERNYDYRYCWLRDASFTMRALYSLGYSPLADAFLSWMLHATRLTHPELQVVYDVYGRTDLPERELSHLRGYRDSRPVRVGNAACAQFQLDVYGEVLDAAERYAAARGNLDGEQARMLSGFADTVCRRWSEPDDGVWETRGERQHYVHSKVLCWVALDRIVRMHERGQLRTDVQRFSRVRDEIRSAIERHGYNARLATYVRTFDGDEVDSSLLTLPLLGYLPADDPRMLSTFERITAELADGALYRRYRPGTEDGLGGDEAAFGICSFWAVECRALAGDLSGAVAAFEKLLEYANDVGLYGEQIEAGNGAARGNFPQAFTHIGLINAALTLERMEERQ
ncbi:MAG: glycoside hydrolase family 15 protein [Chloroflexota bacterium]|nr:glycoside hydrolase family 15 protein [Chloroflexota bacterium]